MAHSFRQISFVWYAGGIKTKLLMKNIELLITDFDGTLIDTFEANCRAYQQAFKENDLTLSHKVYKRIFGLRFDEFMHEVDVTNIELKSRIREAKKQFYPNYFHLLKLNEPLMLFIKAFKNSGKISLSCRNTKAGIFFYGRNMATLERY